MKVLVATRETQGQRSNDFTFCNDGELVIIDGPCDRDAGNPDGFCGCARSFSGIDSHRATTTAKVVDIDLSEDDYFYALWTSHEERGWSIDDPEDVADVEDLAAWLLCLADSFPTGAIVERRLYDIRQRAA